MTRLFAIIADPIAQVKSPALFNDRFAARGMDAVMLPMQVAETGLAGALAGLWQVANLHGIIVSIPHKFAAAVLCDELSGPAVALGAVNVLRRSLGGWHGALLDGIGFVRGLERAGFQARGKRCAVVGAGGAGTATAAALLAAGATMVSVHDIDPAKEHALHSLLDRLYPGRVRLGLPDGETDIAVNATPLGMKATDPLPFIVDDLPEGALVAEVIMSPAETALLDAAEKCGMSVHEGHRMLEGQFEEMWSFFGLESSDGTNR